MVISTVALGCILVCRTYVGMRRSCDISILGSITLSYLLNAAVFILLTVVNLYSVKRHFSLLQRQQLNFSKVFLIIGVLPLFLFDFWIVWLVYTNYTGTNWLFLFQILPTVSKNLNSYCQFLFMISVGKKYPKMEKTWGTSWFVAYQTILNAVMVVHLSCHCILGIFKLCETMNSGYLGFLLGIFDIVYRFLALRRYFKLHQHAYQVREEDSEWELMKPEAETQNGFELTALVLKDQCIHTSSNFDSVQLIAEICQCIYVMNSLPLPFTSMEIQLQQKQELVVRCRDSIRNGSTTTVLSRASN